MAGGHAHPAVFLYKLKEAVAERVTLEQLPPAPLIQSYSVTRAAQRTLSLVTERIDSGAGDFFWLGDPSGSGKTHFLNYFIALRRQLAAAHDDGRELVVALDCSAAGSCARLENELLAALANGLRGSQRHAAPLWRKIGADAGIEIALSEARRTGVLAITVAIDFGSNDPPPFLSNLVQIARNSKKPALTVIAAGIGDEPADATIALVGPEDAAERTVIAIGRVRQLETRWASMARLYQGITIEPFAAAEIFPFHPETLRQLAALVHPSSVPSLARAARDVLAAHKNHAALIYPCELFEAPQVREIIDERLGPEGREAIRRADAAVGAIARPNRHIARQIVQTLALAYLCGKAPALEIRQLLDLLPAAADRIDEEALRPILHTLAARSCGAIAASPVGAAFVPAQPTSADVEQFNSALPLLRMFDPALGPLSRQPDFNDALAHLNRSLANLSEEVNATADTLESFAIACGARLDDGVRRVLDTLLELLGGGARGLLERSARKETAAILQSLAAYRELAAAGAFVPSLIAMKEYLERTRLDPERVDFRHFPEAGNLAAERRLLEAEFGPQAPYSKARESLQARFERFKWNYIEQYRSAHENWRAEMEKVSELAIDIQRSLDALLRLDTIPALGAPAGAPFTTRAAQAREQIKVCRLEGTFSAHAIPICPECGYVLATNSPAPDLTQLLDKITRALNEKLTALSRDAIARLIRKYDHSHRLDGFLKITQAAQTQTLARVLDDDLTAYIARLLQQPEDTNPTRGSGR